MTGRPIVFPGNQFINGGMLLGIVFLVIYLATGQESEGLFVLMLCAALLFGVLLIIPVGGADMPVVISMLNAFTGLSAAGAGFVLDNNSLIIAGSLVGSSGTLLTVMMGRAMNRSLANVLFSAFGSRSPAARGAAGAEDAPGARCEPRRRGDDARLRGQGDRRARLRARGRAGAAHRARAGRRAGEARRRGQLRDPPRRGPHARPHERAARRGRRAVRRAQGDGRDQPRVPPDRRGAR